MSARVPMRLADGDRRDGASLPVGRLRAHARGTPNVQG
jgi:hypothetical protein